MKNTESKNCETTKKAFEIIYSFWYIFASNWFPIADLKYYNSIKAIWFFLFLIRIRLTGKFMFLNMKYSMKWLYFVAEFLILSHQQLHFKYLFIFVFVIARNRNMYELIFIMNVPFVLKHVSSYWQNGLLHNLRKVM